MGHIPLVEERMDSGSVIRAALGMASDGGARSLGKGCSHDIDFARRAGCAEHEFGRVVQAAEVWLALRASRTVAMKVVGDCVIWRAVNW